MNNGMMGFPRQGQGERPEDPLSIRQHREESPSFAVAAGTANAIVIKYNPPVERLTQGLHLKFLSTAANTGAVTVSGDWPGSVNLFRPTSTGPAALTTGEIQNNQMVTAAYDGTQLVITSVLAVGGLSLLNASLTPASTGANTTVTTLQTYTMPASTLIQTGMKAVVKATGTAANNANTKTLTLNVGSSSLATSAAINGGWFLIGELTRTGLNTHYFTTSGIITVGGNPIGQTVNSATAGMTETSTITMSLAGQNGTASAGDITCSELRITLERPGY